MKKWAINLGTLDESYPVLANHLAKAVPWISGVMKGKPWKQRSCFPSSVEGWSEGILEKTKWPSQPVSAAQRRETTG